MSIHFDKGKLIETNKKALKMIGGMIPILIGVVMLISIVTVLVPKSFYSTLFVGNKIADSFIGGTMGSFLTGNPVTGYILGSGFLKNGVSIYAVAAFIASWTTVGLVQIPLEATTLGKKFAIVRNISAFFMSIVVAIITVFVMGFFK